MYYQLINNVECVAIVQYTLLWNIIDRSVCMFACCKVQCYLLVLWYFVSMLFIVILFSRYCLLSIAIVVLPFSNCCKKVNAVNKCQRVADVGLRSFDICFILPWSLANQDYRIEYDGDFDVRQSVRYVLGNTQ